MLLSEQELLRRQKREELIKMGIDPYPAEEYQTNTPIRDILKHWQHNKFDFMDVSVAGRLMGFRIMGSASFAEIQDNQLVSNYILEGTTFAQMKTKRYTIQSLKNYWILEILLVFKAFVLKPKLAKFQFM